MKHRVWCIAVLATLAGGAAGAAPLKIVTGSDYAPFTDPKLPQGGLATDIVRQAFKLSGLDVEIVFAPWKRGYDGTLSGDFAATFPYVPTAERQAEMAYSDAMIDIKQVIFSPVARPVTFAAIGDLKGKTICSPIGYALPDAIKALVGSGAARQEAPKDLDGCGKMLLAGRADYMVGDVFTLGDMFKRVGAADKVKPSQTVLATTQLHLIAGRKVADSAKVIAAFNDGLKKLKASGDYDRIIRNATGGL